MSDATITFTVEQSRDVAARLPEPAAEKLQKLRSLAERAADLYGPARERAEEARVAWQRAKDLQRRVEETAKAGRLVKAREMEVEREDGSVGRVVRHEVDEGRIDRERQAVAKAKSEYDRRAAERDRIGERQQQARGLVTAIEDYLADLPRAAEVELHAGKVARKGDIETLRQQRVSIEEELADVLAAPPTSGEIKASLREEVERLARRGQPGISGTRLSIPTSPIDTLIVTSDGVTGSGRGMVPDAVGLIAWLIGPEALVERIDALVDASADDSVALSSEERAKRAAALREKALECERAEEAATERAEATGLEILRRADADPRAVLNLADDLPAPTEG